MASAEETAGLLAALTGPVVRQIEDVRNSSQRGIEAMSTVSKMVGEVSSTVDATKTATDIIQEQHRCLE